MILLYGILFLQISAIAITNLFYLDRLLGYDCSSTYLQVLEIWNQKTFLLQNWHYTTTLTWDTPLLFAVPLYGLTGNLFQSYGLAILLSLAILCYTSYLLLKLFHPSKKTVLLYYICLFTPFITYEDAFNRIDYFAVMLGILGVYILKIAIIQLLWITTLKLDSLTFEELDNLYRGKYNKTSLKLVFLSLITLGSAFFTALSSGYHVLLFGILPPTLYLFGRNILQDKWTPQSLLSLTFLFMSLFASFLGKTIGAIIIGYTSHDSNLGWTPITYFWSNLLSIFEGYLVLTGALPHWESPDAFSKEGIIFAFLLSLSMGLLITGISTMIQQLKSKENPVTLYFSTLFFTMLLLFVFIYTKYGSHFFEIRYLIPNFILLILFAAIWLGKALDGQNKSLKIALYATVFPTILIVNLNSYHYLSLSQNNYRFKEEILTYLEPFSSPMVYVIGEDSMILGRNLRVFPSDKIYLWAKDAFEFQYWGDRDYFTETSEHHGETILLATEQDFAKLPLYIQNHYEKSHEFQHGWQRVYLSNTNPLDYAVGITQHPYNLDYPYTHGISLSPLGEFDENGYFFVLGDGNFITYGPNLPAPSGTYNITAHYQVFQNPHGDTIGTFDFVVDDGETLLAAEPISASQSSITLENVNLNNVVDHLYQYRISLEPEVEFLVKYFEIQRVS